MRKLFKRRPPIQFLVVSRSRTGSNLLNSLLNAHPQIISGGEEFKTAGKEKWSKVWKDVFGRQKRSVKASGCKLFYYHPLDGDGELWDHLKARTEVVLIHLTRKNVLHTHLSRKIAEKTDAWISTETKTLDLHARRVELDKDECLRDFENTRRWEDEFRHRYRDSHKFIEVDYEQLKSEPLITAKELYKLLEVGDFDPVIELRKQNPESPKELITNYDELKVHFMGSPWEEFFDL